MNIQGRTILLFLSAASLAAIAIALAGLCLLPLPVGSIVANPPALPEMRHWTRAMQGPPLGRAMTITEEQRVPIGVPLGKDYSIAASGTGDLNVFTLPVWVILSGSVIRHPNAATFDTTEGALTSLNLIPCPLDFLATGVARDGQVSSIPSGGVFPHRGNGAAFSSTGIRTTYLVGPATMEILAANRAYAILFAPGSAIGPMDTSPGTPAGSTTEVPVFSKRTRRHPKIFAALLTLHYRTTIGQVRLPAITAAKPFTVGLCNDDLKPFSALLARLGNAFKFWPTHDTPKLPYKLAILYHGLEKMQTREVL